MNLVWTKDAWNQYIKIVSIDKAKTKKINDLIKLLLRDPHNPPAKAEILKHNHEGLRSIRIDKKNRIVYSVEKDSLVIFQCLGHYNDK